MSGGLSMEWTTGGARRCFTKVQRFQETTQKGLSEPAIGSGAPPRWSSAPRLPAQLNIYESGGHVWTGLSVQHIIFCVLDLISCMWYCILSLYIIKVYYYKLL